MDLLQRNLFFILSGVVAIAGIVLLALGLQSMAKVTNRMNDASRLLGQLRSASAGTVNLKAIEKVNARMDAIRANYREVNEWARNLNQCPPLVPGAFPELGSQKKLEFRDAYVAEIDGLLKRLKCGEPPTAGEIALMRDKIRNEQPRGAEAAPTEKAKGPPKPPERSGVLTDEEARSNAEARAALVKAQGLSCYASLDSSNLETFPLHVVNEVYSSEALSVRPEFFWDAQRTLWVQQDVVAALARVNENAARRLKEQGLAPWVGVLPVKELVSIRVSDYIREKSEGKAPALPGGPAAAKPPGTSEESFTGYQSNDLYDVIQFTVKLVADARQTPIILEEVCRGRFYTPLRVAYLVVPENPQMTDRIYGEDPVVSVVMDFEGYYFGDIYRRIMPDAVLQKMGVKRPAEEKGTGP